MNDGKELQLRTAVQDEERRDEAGTYAAPREARPETARSDAIRPAGPAGVPEGDRAAPLLSEDQAKGLRGRWEALQVSFVDEPRRSVEQANQLVGDAIRQLAEGFAAERQSLERKWAQGDNDATTEDLRLALRRYRAFFDRLLCV